MSDKKIFASMINKLKKSPKTIVFTEGTDPRILEAASRLLKEQLMKDAEKGKAYFQSFEK